jgi:hypothetical protein
MMYRFFTSILILLPVIGFSQIGGTQDFSFLLFRKYAKVEALGGELVSDRGRDVNSFWNNPASPTSDVSNWASFSYFPFYSGIKNYMVNFSIDQKKTGIWSGGLNYTDYGSFQGKDDAGNDLGEFSVSSYYTGLSYTYAVEPFAIGGTLKLAHSKIGEYNSTGIFLDLGGQFFHPDKDWVIGLAIQNIGFPVSLYYPGQDFNPPLDIQLGTSFKPEHMPFRFSITAYSLYKYDIVYLDPNSSKKLDANGNEVVDEKSTFDKVASHFVLGGEFVFSEKFNLRLGYNHLRRSELKIEERSGLSGFSFGFMAKVKSFTFEYTRSFYHVTGGRNLFTIQLNMNPLLSKDLSN